MDLSKANFKIAKEKYDKQGWILVESVLDHKEIDLVLTELKQFIEKNKDKFESREINYVNKEEGIVNSIHCLRKYDNGFFKNFQDNPALSEFIGYLLNETAECRGGEAFLKPAQKGLASPMHQDDFYWCVQGHNALTCWIALDDVSEENGGVSYYDESHKLGLLAHEPSFAPGSSQMVRKDLLPPPNKVIVPRMKRGDMLVHHALTIHGSSANTSGKSRRGMTVQYKAKNSSYDLDRKKAYEISLSEQIKLRQLQGT